MRVPRPGSSTGLTAIQDGNARDQVLTRAKSFPFPLHYAHEAARGIAPARNRALTEASARGGRVGCRLAGDRAVLSGSCVTVIEGTFLLP